MPGVPKLENGTLGRERGRSFDSLKWLVAGVDLHHRPLGYELPDLRNHKKIKRHR